MIPSDFVFLEALPITPNGKVDRRALPAPVRRREELQTRFVAPVTRIEEMIAQIWAEILKVDTIGVHDNFFDLGGHSLLATQLVSRVRDTFNIEFPLRIVFECSTVAEFAEQIGSARVGGALSSSIVAKKVDGDYPLSFSQERFWFLNQLEPSNEAYTVTYGFRLSGPLNIGALEQSLAEIVLRHETLRTTFELRNGNPVQVIAQQWTFRISILDLSGVAEVDLDAEVQRLFEDERRRPFDLSADLLLRASLLRLETDEHVLLLSIHHIAWDHWSIGLFFDELGVIYQAFAAGKSSPLSELRLQYKHYALWQRKMFQGPELENHLTYWKQLLADAPPTLNLSTDHPRKPLRNRRGGCQTVLLPKDLTGALEALSRKAGVTFFMTLLAAFQTLLYRLTGDDDIVVGIPVAGRDRSETESLIGLFLNSLALRTRFSGNPTILELLERVRDVALGAYDHQGLPFEKLVEELQPERDLTRTPIFQVFINLYNFQEATLELDRLWVRRLTGAEPAPQFDIEFYIREHNDRTHLTCVYDSDLFEFETIKRMLGHFETLLEAIASEPQQRISNLAILTDAEKHQLLMEWNNTKTDYPNNSCIHRLFEEQVDKTRDAVAVVFDGSQLTYRELNRRANQLAHYLRKLGVGPEVLVGICAERSLEMVVGMLGILKAGGAYVPLDPSYPKERLTFILEDAQVSVLVTQERLLDELPEFRGPAIYLDTGWGPIAKESGEDPVGIVHSENLAYVIYTSGSTGRPKGVAVEHRQLVNYLNGILERMKLSANASFATVSTIAADLGNTIILSSLCAGGSLHVISQERVSDADAMAEYFSRYSIDCLKIVPSHLAALQSLSHPERVLPRHCLILGGEASNANWVKSLRAMAPGCTILNHYGPTEATIGVLTYRLEGELPTHSSTLPLGRPIVNTQIYLLDRNLNLVPVGVPGELHIGGLGLSRGYLKRPELTAEKFIPNYFSGEAGARMYKTGDLARYRSDGNVEFLGRTDDQVKIHGYRVEPGEIEAVLRRHPGVREVAVVAREDTVAQKHLVAYVVASEDRAPTVAGKQRYRLPNGAAVAQLNKHETDYMYQEIFERQAYLRHGITIDDGDCVFDVGANIGLFMLFANQICRSPRVYSFEPNPSVFEILTASASLYVPDARVFNFGLSNEPKTATFTFFPGFSLLSGFYADPAAEKRVVKSFMINQQKAGVSEMVELIEQADAILEERFASQTFTAELRTLSSVIEQEGIECIDLLKINVEKSELDVLLGISDSDWQKIRQIVLEVDVKDNLPTISSLLERHGYEFAVEQDCLLRNTQLCYVYAVRPSGEGMLVREQRNGAHIRHVSILNDPFLSISELRNFLMQKVPEYMVPSAFVFLDSLPLTPNGKVDRQALPAPDQRRPELEERYVAPRTPAEEMIAEIWTEVLKCRTIGVHDNFFDLGGHSLLATQIISRLREAFRLDLPLRALFEDPTVASLAVRIALLQTKQAEVWASLESCSDEAAQFLLAQQRCVP